MTTPSEVRVSRAHERDVPDLAALHRRCLPESMISMLGESAVERYYAMVTSSSLEHVLVIRDEAGASAGCVLALEPGTVMSRFVRRAPVALARDLAWAVASVAMRRRLASRVREGRGERGPGVPEVTQIFTDRAQRGRGLGSALLRGVEDHLREVGQLAYCIHTLRDDNDAGIRFYRREGFTQTGAARSFGDHYLVMTKELT